MKTQDIKNKTSEPWLNADTMHKGSVKWLSELHFVKVEQLFFDDLVKSYTLQLIDSKHLEESKSIVEQLRTSQKETATLLDVIQNHEKGLKIMVDAVHSEQEEEAYRDEHYKLISQVSEFMDHYKALKTQLFDIIKNILKEGKQKRLLP
ncbi:hypothetical protein [Formosa sp. S-31]|uniref:hypothetical protein n=1 Tax=Formosa sp. S-31 TaxID=2790949 RepID=UPI003EBF7F61